MRSTCIRLPFALPAMRKTAMPLLKSLGHAAHAPNHVSGMADTDLPPGPMGEPLASKGLVERLDNMRQHMGLGASDLVVTTMGFVDVLHRRGGHSAVGGHHGGHRAKRALPCDCEKRSGRLGRSSRCGFICVQDRSDRWPWSALSHNERCVLPPSPQRPPRPHRFPRAPSPARSAPCVSCHCSSSTSLRSLNSCSPSSVATCAWKQGKH